MKKLILFAVLALTGCTPEILTTKDMHGVVTEQTTLKTCFKSCVEYPALLITVAEQSHEFKWQIPKSCEINHTLLGSYTLPVQKQLTENNTVRWILTAQTERILVFDICN